MRGKSKRRIQKQRLYTQAYKLFAKGNNNAEIIEQLSQLYEISNKIKIKQLLWPSLQLLVDEIQKIVRIRNGQFYNNEYAVKRNKFMENMIKERRFYTSISQKNHLILIQSFINVSRQFQKEGHLQKYDYLTIEKIFQEIYFPKKNHQKAYKIIDNVHKQKIINNIQQQTQTLRHHTKKDKQMRDIQQKSLKRGPILKLQRFDNKQKQKIKQLQQKERQMSQVQLQYHILMKRSQMMKIQYEIKEIKQSIEQVQRSKFIKPLNDHLQIKQNRIKKMGKKQIQQKVKQVKTLKGYIEQQMVDNTIIEQEIQTQSTPPQQIISEQLDSQYQIEKGQRSKRNSSRNIRKSKTKNNDDKFEAKKSRFNRNIYKNRIKSINKSQSNNQVKKQSNYQAKTQVNHMINNKTKIQAKAQPKHKHKTQIKKQVYKKKEDSNIMKTEILHSTKLQTKLQQKRLNQLQNRKLTAQQDYRFKAWHINQQQKLIKLLNKYNKGNTQSIQKELINYFGRKVRFNHKNLIKKIDEIYKISSRKFLSQIARRNIFELSEMKGFCNKYNKIYENLGSVFKAKVCQKFYLQNKQKIDNKSITNLISDVNSIHSILKSVPVKQKIQQPLQVINNIENKSSPQITNLYKDDDFDEDDSNDDIFKIELQDMSTNKFKARQLIIVSENDDDRQTFQMKYQTSCKFKDNQLQKNGNDIDNKSMSIESKSTNKNMSSQSTHNNSSSNYQSKNSFFMAFSQYIKKQNHIENQ